MFSAYIFKRSPFQPHTVWCAKNIVLLPPFKSEHFRKKMISIVLCGIIFADFFFFFSYLFLFFATVPTSDSTTLSTKEIRKENTQNTTRITQTHDNINLWKNNYPLNLQIACFTLGGNSLCNMWQSARYLIKNANISDKDWSSWQLQTWTGN